MNQAIERLNEVGAVQGILNEETGLLDLDMTPLVGGAIVPLNFLIELVANYSEMGRDVVIQQVREYIDGMAFAPDQT